MKKWTCALMMTALLACILSGCRNQPSDPTVGLDGVDSAYGDSLEDMGAYDGYFDEKVTDITITCVSGTEDCYRLEGNVLTFTEVAEDSVYAVSGKLNGNIVIDIGDDHRFDLELQGVSLVSDSINPITINSGDQVSITAKAGSKNYIYDMRSAVDESDETVCADAIYSCVDLKICGKGSLFLISENNRGIHTKDDLKIKNLSLLVSCVDHALKGNDSVKISSGDLTLIATKGDGIKTNNSNISSKGNQRGTVTIDGGTVRIYAACDGIDSAYDVVVDGETTQLEIYTGKYSNHSQQESSPEDESKTDQEMPPDMDHPPEGMDSMPDNMGHTPVDMGKPGNMGGRPGGMGGGRPDDMGGGHGGMGGFGGMDGNTNKSETSMKGIKSGNAVTIIAGTIQIKSYDDAIHADGGQTLENGETSLGNVSVSGGMLTLYSNDDGIHADQCLRIVSGTIRVDYSYEGLEGNQVEISGGNISIVASDDGINGTATSDTAISISGGKIYVFCSGDGLDSNSRASYTGIVISGGSMVVMTNGSGDSAIDTEQGYTYSGGSVIAIMPSRGMTNELTHCKDFSSIATKTTLKLSAGDYLSVVDGSTIATVEISETMSAMVVYLGSNSAQFETKNTTSANLDSNGIWWRS